jgi:hypothetical protein
MTSCAPSRRRGRPRRRLSVVRGRRAWYVIGLPDPAVSWCGPYSTLREAEEDRVGLERFFRREAEEDEQ